MIYYFFTSGRIQRLASIDTGNAPNEFLFGADIFAKSHNVEIVEEQNSNQSIVGKQTLLERIERFFIERFFGLTMLVNSARHYANILRKCDLAICVPDSVALSMLYFRKKYNSDFRVIYLGMGYAAKLKNISNKYPVVFNLAKKYLLTIYCQAEHIVFIGIGEYDFFRKSFPTLSDKIHLIQFGVDYNFWIPSAVSARCDDSYVLFVGNDNRRDFALLHNIAESLPDIRFKFVSKKMQSSSYLPNVEVLTGDWKDENLSDEEIKELYIDSKMVILPLKESLQPSGQSVCLQAMSCGKCVVISKTEGFWDPEGLVDGRDLIMVSQPSVDEWRSTILSLYRDGEKLAYIGQSARKRVGETYNSKLFYEKLSKLVLNA